MQVISVTLFEDLFRSWYTFPACFLKLQNKICRERNNVLLALFKLQKQKVGGVVFLSALGDSMPPIEWVV